MTGMKRTSNALTRRDLAAAVAVVAVSAAKAQTPPVTPVDELAAARAQSKQTSAALRKFSVPALLEPSFAFRP